MSAVTVTLTLDLLWWVPALLLALFGAMNLGGLNQVGSTAGIVAIIVGALAQCAGAVACAILAL